VPRKRKRTLFNNPALAELAGIVLNAYGELILRTSRIKLLVDPQVNQLVLEQRTPVIYALWHRHVFFMPLLRRFERRPLVVLLSSHRDARIVGVAARLRGVQLVEGSSTRGGVQAYRQLLRCLERQVSVCITPDGPKGPPGVVKDGLIRLARQSGCVVVPVALAASRFRSLRSWDHTLVPLPFGSYLVALGPPCRCAAEADVEAERDRLARALDGLGQAAATALAASF
jgi:lysophospholipid acyltransferase (LPLAT)-like uncharacterized protein